MNTVSCDFHIIVYKVHTMPKYISTHKKYWFMLQIVGDGDGLVSEKKCIFFYKTMDPGMNSGV